MQRLVIAGRVTLNSRPAPERPELCYPAPAMMKRENFPIDNIYVPVKRRATLVQARVDELAQSMLKDGQQTPILVRVDARKH
jgi:hypothetical protein